MAYYGRFQLTVASVGWSEPAGDALTPTPRAVKGKLDRVDALGRTIRRSAAPTNKRVQLIAKIVGDGFMEAHAHDAPLVLGQAKPFVKADRHMHAAADQPASPIKPGAATRRRSRTGGHFLFSA